MNAKNGSSAMEDVPEYLHRVHGTGLHFSLIVGLKMNNRDVDDLCSGPTKGFKIISHSPFESLDLAKKIFFLAPGQAVYSTVSPHLVRTTKSAQQYRSDIRQCLLNSERNLRFYKYYTKRNCEVECLSNYTLAKCGCVHFSMPRTTSVLLISSLPAFLSFDMNYFFFYQTRLKRRCVDQQKSTV